MSKNLFSVASIKRYLWHIATLISFLLVVAGMGVLWYSGSKDAHHALEDGRRLVISLTDGTMTGWQYGMPKPEAKHEEKPEETKEAATHEEKPDDAHEDVKHEEEAPKADTVREEEHKDESVAEKPKQEEHPEDKVSEEKADSASEQTKEAEQRDKAADTIVPSVTAVRGVNDSLTEKTKYGTVPRIGDDGTKPWEYYAKPAKYKGDKPFVAIVVMGVGTSKEMTEKIIKLPENITLSFSPYAKNVESWATAARVTGHEIMVDLPLQPADYPASDPGMYGLLIEAKPDANAQKLNWLMSRFGAFTGFMTPLNEGFISDTYSFAALADMVGKRGLILTLSHDVAKDSAKKVIEDSKDPILVADLQIDEQLSESAIKSRLSTLAQIAKEKGYAIGIAQSYPVTIELLKDLPAHLDKEGMALMPLSYIARKRYK